MISQLALMVVKIKKAAVFSQLFYCNEQQEIPLLINPKRIASNYFL